MYKTDIYNLYNYVTDDLPSNNEVVDVTALKLFQPTFATEGEAGIKTGVGQYGGT